MPEKTHYQHNAVMKDEVMKALAIEPNAIVLDTTAGGGGHLSLIAQAIGPTGKIIALDRDLRAHEPDAAGGVAAQYPNNIKLVHAPFSEILTILNAEGLTGKVTNLLCDLGVSSPQLDVDERGFSFMRDGPLDMRMDTSSGFTAYELMQSLTEKDLADTIYRYGEERGSRKIARLIKNSWPIENSTLAFASLVSRALRQKRGKIHPATKTFQALRIAVNEELLELETILKALPAILSPGGRAVFISFHSLEDRIIKHTFKSYSQSDWKIFYKKPVQAGEAEIIANPRARSAKLRGIEKPWTI